jgi:hypothetical protein
MCVLFAFVFLLLVFVFPVVFTGDMKGVCKSYIREIAVQPQTVNSVVLGGFDQKLNFLDLNRPDIVFTQRLDMQGIIGSVKWAPFHGSAYVSTALDDGKFYLFDARVKIKEASFFFDSRKEDMYTHERYNEFGVLLGYGDGEFKHIDMRNASKVSVHKLLDTLLNECSARQHVSVLTNCYAVLCVQAPHRARSVRRGHRQHCLQRRRAGIRRVRFH